MRLDAVPLRALSPSAVNAAVQLVSPRLPLRRGSVGSNLACAAGGASPGLLAQVAAFCELDPELETSVGEAGRDLPEGLRARACLARALLAGPRLLLIDDPAFHTDALARGVMEQVCATCDATVLWVVPQDAPLVGADRVWRLDGGVARELPPAPLSPEA